MDGMPLGTVDGKPILRVNGIQTQSESYVCLLAETGQLAADGVSHLRLMPQAIDMVAVAQAFRAVLDGAMPVEEAGASLRDLCGTAPFSNGFYHGTAGHEFVAEVR